MNRRAGLFGRLIQALNKRAGVTADAAAVKAQVRIMTAADPEPQEPVARPRIRVLAGAGSRPGL
ncbi:hypothetical protein [Azospirillum doebereinerae]